MGAAGDLLLTLVGVLVVLFGSIEVATGCLIAFWLLVPGLLIVPYGPHFLLVDRLVLWVFAVRLLLRSGRPDEPRGRAFALTPLHGAMAALLVAAYTAGVLLAPRSVSLAGDLHAFLYVLDLVILFVVVLAAVRTIGVRRVVNLIAWGVLVAVLIGFIERTTKFSYGQFFFEHLPLSYIPSIAPGTLSVRGAAVRSQGAAQFALEYGWVLAMLLPLTVVATIRWSQGREPWRKMVVLLPIAVFVAVVFSGGRSAVIAAAVATLVFLVFTGGDRRILRMLGVIAVAAVLVALFDPSLVTAPFSAGSAADPASVRLERLPFLFSLVVHRPFTGLGFNGVSNVFGGVDNGYALMYATIGVVGVTAWIALMVTAMATTARTLRSPRGTDSRNVGAACLIGIVAVAFAMATYDLVSTLQSQWALVFLAAVGVAAAETVPRPERVRRRWGYRAALPLVGLGVGCLLVRLRTADVVPGVLGHFDGALARLHQRRTGGRVRRHRAQRHPLWCTHEPRRRGGRHTSRLPAARHHRTLRVPGRGLGDRARSHAGGGHRRGPARVRSHLLAHADDRDRERVHPDRAAGVGHDGTALVRGGGPAPHAARPSLALQAPEPVSGRIRTRRPGLVRR